MKNILLMGGGWIAETLHVPFLSPLKHVNNIYILDSDREAVERKFVNYKKVKVISEIELAQLHYDVVFILTPNFLHYEQLCQFLDKGIKILVEKPICISSEQADKIQKLMYDAKSSVYVSAPLRYRNDMRLIKKVLSSDELGKIYHAEITWLKRRGAPGSQWFAKKKLSGGGVLMDMGPHLLDLFYWFMGPRKPIKCLGSMSSLFLNNNDAYASWHRKEVSDTQSDVEDNSFSLLTFEDMSLALNLAWASNIENDYAQVKIYGSCGSLDALTSLGFSTNVLYRETKLTINVPTKSDVKTIEIEARTEPFYKMLSSFMQEEKVDLPNTDAALSVINNIINLYHCSETSR